MVHNDYAYIGQARYGGFTIVDVTNPHEPRPAGFVETAPGALNIHLQVHDNLLLVVDGANLFSIYGSPEAYYSQSMEGWSSNRFGQRGVDFMAGMRVYDISNPTEPRQIGYLERAKVDSFGIDCPLRLMLRHRFFGVCDGTAAPLSVSQRCRSR